jgi:uncharacterized protein (DUF2164 family)
MKQNRKNKFDFESETEKLNYLNEMIAFFHDERDEEIGIVAAEEILDFFLQTMGEKIYKKAVKDSQKVIKEKFDDLEVELDILSAK